MMRLVLVLQLRMVKGVDAEADVVSLGFLSWALRSRLLAGTLLTMIKQ